MSRCNSCQHGIVWARSTKTRRMMPVNAEVDPRGNITLEGVNPAGEVLAVVWPKGEIPFGQQMHTSHFATCPHAGSWRGKRKT